MKKITLTFAAVALALSLQAQSAKDGEKLLNYGKYQSAKQMLQNANKEEENYYLGLAELGLGNIAAAKQIFSKDPKNFYNQAGMARVLFAEGKKEEAKKLLQEIVDGAKKKEVEKYKIAADAITYSEGGAITDAIAWYQKALERGPDAKTYIALGDAYLRIRTGLSDGEAMNSYIEAEKLGTDNSLAYSRMGALWYAARNYDAALENYEKAKNADPSNPLPYRDLADAYYRVGKYDLAKTNIEKYLSLSDKSNDDLVQYVHILFLSKHYPEALNKLNEVMAAGVEKPYFYRLKGYSQYETKEYQEALKNMRLFFSKETKPTAIIQDDYMYTGRIMTALAGLDSANAQMYSDSANYYLEKAVALDTASDKAETYRKIAETFKDAKRYNDAGKWYGKIIAQNPNAASIDYYWWGYWSYYGRNYTDAAKAFATMTEKYPDDRHISLYWQAAVGAATDPEAKTGAGVKYFEDWFAHSKEGVEKNAAWVMQGLQYLCYYYYNQSNDAKAKEYAQKILAIQADNQFAKQIMDYYNAQAKGK
jgi:tetratricopeptide (TPR) repeat protein